MADILSELYKLAENMTETKRVVTANGRYWLYGYHIIPTEEMSYTVQNRRHKKRRINKKWLKRYGVTKIPRDDVLVVETEKTMIMHPRVLKALQACTFFKSSANQEFTSDMV